MLQERIEIKLSKGKGTLTLLGSVALVMTSCWLIFYASNREDLRFSRLDPVIVMVIGWVGVVFFGLAGSYALYKLFDNKPGLVIDKDGIYDNSSAAAGHLIKWERIKGISLRQVMSTKFLLIDIYDPEEFIHGTYGIRKKLMWSTYKIYGTPISIATVSLNCDFEELVQLIKARLDS